MKKIIYLIMLIIVVFVGTTLFFSYLILNSGNILHNFDFIKVDNVGSNFYLYFEDVKSAEEYDVIVSDVYGISLEQVTVTEPNVTLELKNLEYNSEYEITVIAYDNKGNSLEINNPYSFIWTEPSFAQDNNLVLDSNVDNYITINGSLESGDYYYRIKKDGKIIDSQKLKDVELVVPADIFKGEQTIITYEIVESSQVISSILLYSGISPIGDINITSPKNEVVLNYDDVMLTFTGGENATNYHLKILDEGKVVKSTDIHKNTVVLSSEIFNKASSYKIVLEAQYQGYDAYTKSSEIIVTMNEKETLDPVYIDYNYKNIKAGTLVELKSPNKDTEIYYTLDGSDPITNGTKYTEAIKINKDMVVKAVNKQDKKNDSIVKTFDFKVQEKKEFKVYLSPSNQHANIGISSVGYTNEMKEMNKVTDYVEECLKQNGVIVYRNESWGNINRWIADSNYLQVDAHIAIHSNASVDHTANGIETWVDDDTSEAYSLAHLIQNDLFALYYDQEDVEANRGVKYAKGALGEVNNLYLDFGLLIEVAYHDFESDAKWIMDNQKLIGYTIADSILKYYQII